MEKGYEGWWIVGVRFRNKGGGEMKEGMGGEVGEEGGGYVWMGSLDCIF